MAAPICVLIYGEAPSLSEVRSILSFFDFQVCSAKTFSRLTELPPSDTIDLLIFCDSICPEERNRFMSFASTRWPQLRSVCINANGFVSTPAVLGRVAEALSGPSIASFQESITKAPANSRA